MTKKHPKRLILNLETLRKLQIADLAKVQGGNGIPVLGPSADQWGKGQSCGCYLP